MSDFMLLAALTPDRIRGALDEVYRRPEFREPADSSPSWLTQVLRDFAQWLGRLRVESPPLFWLLLAICLALLALLVYRVGRRVRRAFFLEGTASAGVDAPRRARLSAGYADEARRWAEAGDYTEAIRCLFLSLVYRLDESGRVAFQKAYTNHEYLDLFADQAEVRAGLRVFVEALDEHWYGQRPASPERYRQCLTLAERLR